ncbi:hypothetical protein DUNSADRAFT_1125 [Dunaliella salina]|uniref:Uncharacterized protein n=1 Tax=Dunaliella salina TaxID=3046 RepID=A0ABQ7FXX9_DUNSA|nr:hypothetical protein DUNSADRAFT_1125 [Dunaliella salina]|eukprot:KAF5827223.1 hypothetical protein DUNSADRAFT_1125 [Dunaliella salina]
MAAWLNLHHGVKGIPAPSLANVATYDNLQQALNAGACQGLLLQCLALVETKPWAIVQVRGIRVVNVDCLEGHRPVELLQRDKTNDFWQALHVTGGSGGGINHPHGVILLGPEDLARFRNLFSTPPPPGNALKGETASKLAQGTLRLVPPTTFLKMCRVYAQKWNAYHILKVVRPGH